jgi:DNA polymerase-3 subunit gamma/tau
MGKEITVEERKELELKYRPLEFKEFFGFEKEIESILSILHTKHTYLFYGPRGCGKTTLGRLLAYELGIKDIDIKEIDAASNTGVDDARKIRENAQFSPMASKHKIYIIDEFHRLTGNAEDALLKLFEEPPPHCYFVLCTSEIDKVRTTIKSRCAKYEVKPLTTAESKELLDWITDSEKLDIPDEVKFSIIDKCECIPREMIIALDMIKNMKDPKDAIDLIQSTGGKKEIADLCWALLNGDKWEKVAEILKAIPDEAENVRYGVLGIMNSMLLKNDKRCAKIALIMDYFMESFMYTKKAGLSLACFKILNE